MKLNFSQRLTLLLGSLLVLAVGVVILLAGLQVQAIDISKEGAGFFSLERLLILLGGLLTILFAIYVLVLPFGSQEHRGDYVIQKTTSGEMRVSLIAVQDILHKALSLHPDVKVQSLGIIKGRKGLEVDARVISLSTVDIPQIAKSLQSSIKEQMQHAIGMTPKDVRITVIKANEQQSQ